MSIVVSDPDILGGKKVIAGTRIPITLLKRLISDGWSNKKINQEYPTLTLSKISGFRKLIGLTTAKG